MRFDVQAYEDGQMDPQAKREFELALENSTELRKELEGFRAFRKTLEDQGLAEPIPYESLERMLKEVVNPSQVNRPTFRLRNVLVPVVAAAAIALGVLWMRQDRLALARTPELEQSTIDSVAQAERFIEDYSDMDVPRFTLVQEAVPTIARVGEKGSWACIDFEYKGETFYLYMSPDASPLRNGSVRKAGPNLAFYEGHGTGWEANNQGYYLKGGDSPTRTRIAEYLANQMATSRT